MLENLINEIILENKDVIKQISYANPKTHYLQNAVPLYNFALEQMKFLSERLLQYPLDVKIPLGAKWCEKSIGIKDSEISRQLIIFEYSGILKTTISILSGRFGKNVNTYQIVRLLPMQKDIQSKIESIKDFYENVSPLAKIRRADIPKYKT